MKVTVTAEDLSNGDYRSCFHNPIALAIARETQREVATLEIECRVNPWGPHVPLPKAAREFIITYCDTIHSPGRVVNPPLPQPFQFELKGVMRV